MLRPKKKISKRELKEDALITSYVKARTFYDENKRNISIGITALVVVVLASIVYINNRNANEQEASTELGKVFQLYDSGQYQTAIEGTPERNIKGLKAIVDNYGGTDAGNFAKFYLANAYYKLNKFHDALEQFEDFSPEGQLLSVSRLMGIGQCYEAIGQYENAAEHYEKAATSYPKAVEAAESLNLAAMNYAEAGKKEKALDLFKKLKKDYPTTTYARDADRFIAKLTV